MKIAVWHNLVGGGGKRAVSYHIRALKQRGHQVEVWTPDTSLNDPIFAMDEEVKHHILPLEEELGKLKYPRFSFQHYQYINKRNGLLKKHCAACADEIKNGGFDIVFASACRFNYMSFMGLYAAPPSVIYLGEPYRWNYEATPDLVWAAPESKLTFTFIKSHLQLTSNRIQVFEEINAARAYNKILVNSMFSRESVMRSYGLDSEVCYLGIDDSFFLTGAIEKKPYVVSVGLIYYLKGIDRVIRSIAKVPSSVRPNLICIGNGTFPDYKKEMEKLADELKVELEIRLNVAEDDMKRVVSEAVAMIYMPRLEPFGFSPLEANALGTAVVGIAEGGVKETIIHGKNGFLVHYEDYRSAAGYIENLVRDPGYAKEAGLQSKEHVKQHWSFENLTNNIEVSLLNVLNNEA